MDREAAQAAGGIGLAVSVPPSPQNALCAMRPWLVGSGAMAGRTRASNPSGPVVVHHRSPSPRQNLPHPSARDVRADLLRLGHDLAGDEGRHRRCAPGVFAGLRWSVAGLVLLLIRRCAATG